MDKQRYAAIEAEALRRIEARRRGHGGRGPERQTETMASVEPGEAEWIAFASVDELMEAIRAAGGETDRD